MHAYILPYPHTYEKHSSIPANSCLLHPLYQKSRRATSGKAGLLLLLVLYKNKRLWMNHHPQPASLGTHFFKEWYTKLQHRKFSRTKHYTYPSMKKKLYAFAFSSAQCFIVLNCTEQSLLVILSVAIQCILTHILCCQYTAPLVKCQQENPLVLFTGDSVSPHPPHRGW